MKKSRHICLLISLVLALFSGVLFLEHWRIDFPPITDPLAWRRPDPAPSPRTLVFGDQGQAWTVEIRHGSYATNNFAVLTIYRDAPSTSTQTREFYHWRPDDPAQMPAANGFWKQRPHTTATPHRLVAGSSNMSLYAVHLNIVNLDRDADPEIFIYNDRQPPDVMKSNDVRLGRGAYMVDYRNGRFTLRPYRPFGLATFYSPIRLQLTAAWFLFSAILLALFSRYPDTLDTPLQRRTIFIRLGLVVIIGFALLQFGPLGFFVGLLLTNSLFWLLMIPTLAGWMYKLGSLYAQKHPRHP